MIALDGARFMKDDQEQPSSNLVSSATRGLTRNSGLVRRGLDDLVTRQGIPWHPIQHGITLTNEAGMRRKNPQWPLIEQVIRELNTGYGNSFCCLRAGDKWVQTLHGFNGYHLEWCLNSTADDQSFVIYRASYPSGSSETVYLEKHDRLNDGERRDLLHIDDVVGAFRTFYRGEGMPASLEWRVLDVGLSSLRSGTVRFPKDRSVGLLYTYDAHDTKSDGLYGYTMGKPLGEAKGIIILPDNEKELRLELNDDAAGGFSFFDELGTNDLQALHLDFWNVNFDEREMAHLEHLTGLRKLFLQSPAITDNSLVSIGRFTNLQWLALSSTRISDSGLEYLVHFDELQVLDLEKTLISDAGAVQLSALVDLEQLSLKETNIGDIGLEDICGLRSLLVLNLGQTRITDAGLAACRDLKELQSLDLADTAVTDAGLMHIQGMSKLKTLVLSGTRITFAGLEYIKGMAALEWLNLRDTQIIDTALIPLGNLTKLRGLGLNREQTTAYGMSELKRLIPNCTIGDHLVP